MLLSDAVKPLFAGTELRYPQFLPQCPVCTATASKELFVLRGFSHRQCRGCGFIFVNPRLSDEGARIYYNSEYYRQYCDNNERPINEVFGPYCRTFGPGLPDFVDRLRALCPRGRVVDVGCGLGALLASLPATDFERVGVEYNEAAARFAREHFGLRIVPDLADLRGAGTGFDLVTAIEVIEHVADPLACMQDLAQLLLPTGVLVVTTPNIGGLDYHLHGRQCAHFCAPSHVNFFTVETLTRLAARAGLQRQDYGYRGGVVSYVHWWRTRRADVDFWSPEAPTRNSANLVYRPRHGGPVILPAPQSLAPAATAGAARAPRLAFLRGLANRLLNGLFAQTQMIVVFRRAAG
jgi:2-polyprenyl-3-methyl-5-hydroxy-6-metoxy-1,4-benzoquinol methylase